MPTEAKQVFRRLFRVGYKPLGSGTDLSYWPFPRLSSLSSLSSTSIISPCSVTTVLDLQNFNHQSEGVCHRSTARAGSGPALDQSCRQFRLARPRALRVPEARGGLGSGHSAGSATAGTGLRLPPEQRPGPQGLPQAYAFQLTSSDEQKGSANAHSCSSQNYALS